MYLLPSSGFRLTGKMLDPVFVVGFYETILSFRIGAVGLLVSARLANCTTCGCYYIVACAQVPTPGLQVACSLT